MNKHLPISREMETVMKNHLSLKFSGAAADRYWKKILTKYGYLDIMPAFCNSDYPAMEYINAALIRKHTCANSDICDYWIVGDKSEEAKEHPKKTDEKGYWYND